MKTGYAHGKYHRIATAPGGTIPRVAHAGGYIIQARFLANGPAAIGWTLARRICQLTLVASLSEPALFLFSFPVPAPTDSLRDARPDRGIE